MILVESKLDFSKNWKKGYRAHTQLGEDIWCHQGDRAADLAWPNFLDCWRRRRWRNFPLRFFNLPQMSYLSGRKEVVKSCLHWSSVFDISEGWDINGLSEIFYKLKITTVNIFVKVLLLSVMSYICSLSLSFCVPHFDRDVFVFRNSRTLISQMMMRIKRTQLMFLERGLSMSMISVKGVKGQKGKQLMSLSKSLMFWQYFRWIPCYNM